LEIVRLRAFGRAGGGGTRRSSVLRGGASPALNDPALRGLIWAGVWPWSTAVACVVHWRARTGGAGLGTGSSTARAARRPRSSPERDAWAPRARQGLRDLAQGVRGDLGRLPRTRIGRSCSARSPALMASGGARRCARGPGVVELLRSSKLHGSMRGSAVKVVQGSVKHRSRQRQEISRIRLTSGGGVREKFPAIGRVAVEEKGSRVILDSWSESI